MRASSLFRRFAVACLALLCAAAALTLAWHHPLAPRLAMAVCLLVGVAIFVWPVQWPAILFALLPLAGLAPLTGWLVVEELDLLVLSVLAGGYLRFVTHGWPAASREAGTLRVWLLMLPMLVSTLISLVRGTLDAGGPSLGWWQGYNEPMNSLRLAKAIVEVYLLVPLWRMSCSTDLLAARAALTRGMVAMLAVVSIVVLWERVAFTGLLNFSTDYRATGPFWEMHVGGAALDAALVMSVPFVAVALMRTQRLGTWLSLAVMLLLGLYSCLVTFSRIVYAAVPVGLVVAWWLSWRGVRTHSAVVQEGGQVVTLVSALVYLPMAVVIFMFGGYRGLLALLGAVALSLSLTPLLCAFRELKASTPAAGRRAGLVAVAVAFSVVAIGWAISGWLTKGAYLAYGIAWLTAAAFLAWARQRPSVPAAGASFGAWIAALWAMGLVSTHWGGAPGAWLAALMVALVMLALVATASRSGRIPLLSLNWRWQGQVIILLMLLSAGVGVFFGGSYMGARVGDVSRDGGERRNHWNHAVELLHGTEDWLFGVGLGRYHAHHGMSGVPEDQTGDYRLVSSQSGSALVLTSGKHPIGSGQLFRFSQRIPYPGGSDRQVPELLLKLDIKHDRPIDLRAEVCEKHLLYWETCVSALQELPAGDGRWQTIAMRLTGQRAFASAAYAPKPLVFSIGLSSPGSKADFDNLSLTEADGRELLVNGDLDRGLARWFFSSDRHHLPWHAKNLFVHLLVEQGLLGVLAFAGLVLITGRRLVVAAGDGDALAPTLAAALAGVLVVGWVDSLFDMPRIALLVLFLIAVSLERRASTLPKDSPRPAGHRM